MEIRRLAANDAATFRELRLRGFREHPEAFTTSAEELEALSVGDMAARLAAPHLKFWGAFDDGKLCGHVGLERETRLKAWHKGTVIGMYVTPDVRGQGVGLRLLQALLPQARSDGILHLVLTVTDGNTGATSLYESCGFRSFGIEPRAIRVDGRFFAKNHMYLEIAP